MYGQGVVQKKTKGNVLLSVTEYGCISAINISNTHTASTCSFRLVDVVLISNDWFRVQIALNVLDGDKANEKCFLFTWWSVMFFIHIKSCCRSMRGGRAYVEFVIWGAFNHCCYGLYLKVVLCVARCEYRQIITVHFLSRMHLGLIQLIKHLN